jgi:hypothetical protein
MRIIRLTCKQVHDESFSLIVDIHVVKNYIFTEAGISLPPSQIPQLGRIL